MKLKTLIAVAVASAFPALALAQAATSQPQEGRTPPGSPASPGSIDQREGTMSSGTTARGATSRDSALFNRLDKNHDGFVSRDEARDATELQGRFAELDKDNDGKLSAAEMRAMEADRAATGKTGVRGSTGGMGGSSGPAGTSSGPNPAGEAPRGGISR